jgi:hypothetical protein
MFGEFVASLGSSRQQEDLPPVTDSLIGIMKGQHVSEKDYKRHIRAKYS